MLSLIRRSQSGLRRITLLLLFAASSMCFSHSLTAAIITFDGVSNNSGTTSIPWVFGSTMWGHIDTAGGTGTSVTPATGFTSLEGLDITKLTYTFGDLDLTDYASPTASTPGYEVYTDDGSATPFEFLFDGALWATGTVNFLRTDVSHSSDTDATGLLSVTLLSGGVDNAFFNELISLTNGTGEIELFAHSFAPVSTGQFTSVTTLELPTSTVPVPASAILFLSGFIGLGFFKRRKSA